MARGFYCAFPFDLAMDPSVLRLKWSEWGMAGVGCYYELRLMYGRALQTGGRVTRDDVPGMAASWRMGEEDAFRLMDFLAACGLIDPQAWEDGFIGIEDVAEDAAYRLRKSEAGRQGGRPRKAGV